MAGRGTPIFVSREAAQQAQQGLQYANTFLVEKAGLSPAAASAVIGGVLAIPTGGWGVALAASGAFISTEILETETAQRAIAGLADDLMAIGMSERTAYSASARIIGVGVGLGVGFGLAGAAQGVATGLSRFEGVIGNNRGGIPLSSRGKVVIGENMEGRVIPKAKELGADYYKPRKSVEEIGLQRALNNNVRWLSRQKSQGKEIIDIGIDPNSSDRSVFYGAERKFLERRR